MTDQVLLKDGKKQLFNLPPCTPVNIEFQDLTYTVPQGRKGSKLLLRSISGQFQSGQLHAILGPSGAGKTTLLNVLAGYKSPDVTGSISVNGEPRNTKQFRKISRYIMQQDLLQPMLTVQESMVIAADLKLSRKSLQSHKLNTIAEILDILRLTKTKDTKMELLSGGERKRLSIALELLNNPPVIFLDEPTTGLDDLSSSQCIKLLKILAQGGRNVICSLHTPSATLFALFDNIYVVAKGQCVYQGYGAEVVPYLDNLGLPCPKHFNPADFVIEVCSGDYGDFNDKMVAIIDNGRCTNYCKKIGDKLDKDNCNLPDSARTSASSAEDCTSQFCEFEVSTWYQFRVLLRRMWLQTYRNSSYLIFKTVLYAVIGLIMGAFYSNMGNDGSKTLFNFGYCYTCTILFLYVPMMPILLGFPTEVQLLKREYFNRWYGLLAYFSALSISTVPLQILLGALTLIISYTLSDQPLELDRFLMFFVICMLTAFISESFGLLISSTLNILNGMFVGPCLAVPLMLLAVYGFGSGSDVNSVPALVRIAMYFSYLRYALKGIVFAIYGGNRPKLPCPDEEDFCMFTDPRYFMEMVGMKDIVFWKDIVALVVFLIIFRLAAYYLLRQRLTPNKTFKALHVVGRLIKSHFSMARY